MSAKSVIEGRACFMAMALAIDMGMDPSNLGSHTPASGISEGRAESILASRARCLATELQIDAQSRRRQ
jgi:hypothetical protein